VATELPILALPAVAVAVHRLSARMARHRRVVTVAQELRLVFLAVLLLTPVAVVVVWFLAPQAQAALAAAVLVRQVQLARLVQPILVAVEAVVERPVAPARMAALAALASSSSSTKSALPQSLPSSHRRSGLHQRVR